MCLSPVKTGGTRNFRDLGRWQGSLQGCLLTSCGIHRIFRITESRINFLAFWRAAWRRWGSVFDLIGHEGCLTSRAIADSKQEARHIQLQWLQSAASSCCRVTPTAPGGSSSELGTLLSIYCTYTHSKLGGAKKNKRGGAGGGEEIDRQAVLCSLLILPGA